MELKRARQGKVTVKIVTDDKTTDETTTVDPILSNLSGIELAKLPKGRVYS